MIFINLNHQRNISSSKKSATNLLRDWMIRHVLIHPTASDSVYMGTVYKLTNSLVGLYHCACFLICCGAAATSSQFIHGGSDSSEQSTTLASCGTWFLALFHPQIQRFFNTATEWEFITWSPTMTWIVNILLAWYVWPNAYYFHTNHEMNVLWFCE